MPDQHNFSELEFLNIIHLGTASFSRDDFSSLEAIDIQLEGLRERGYIDQIIRASRLLATGDSELLRVFVMGHLTERGKERRKLLRSMDGLDSLLRRWIHARLPHAAE